MENENPMALISLFNDGPRAVFDRQQFEQLGEELSSSYQSATPFPHAVIDNFLDADALRPLLAEFPSRVGKDHFDRSQERLKYQFAPWEVEGDALRNLLTQLNSAAFVRFLEKLTGIKGLIPDPYYEGGGLHETMPGGHLSVHADFNVHGRMKLQRRLNFLLYLNDDWSPDYGGQLELWDRDMKACQVKVIPEIGRAVIFNTDLDSFHGHPEPLTCPAGRSRRSIATYYYTAPEHGVASLPKRTTVFKERGGTSDKRDWKITYQHFVNDWVPFKLAGVARKVGDKLLK